VVEEGDGYGYGYGYRGRGNQSLHSMSRVSCLCVGLSAGHLLFAVRCDYIFCRRILTADLGWLFRGWSAMRWIDANC
jgi:hypothetical protein